MESTDIQPIILDAESTSETLTIRGRGTAEVILFGNRENGQFIGHVDVLHANPKEKGSGTTIIDWKVQLQWDEGPGYSGWYKILTISNRSRSEQKVSVYKFEQI